MGLIFIVIVYATCCVDCCVICCMFLFALLTLRKLEVSYIAWGFVIRSINQSRYEKLIISGLILRVSRILGFCERLVVKFNSQWKIR